jgi:hypothetical protein
MLIEARGLSVAFGARQVLSGLELALAAGEVVGIRGKRRALGCDPREPLSPEKRPGVLLSDEGLFEELSARLHIRQGAARPGLLQPPQRPRSC